MPVEAAAVDSPNPKTPGKAQPKYPGFFRLKVFEGGFDENTVKAEQGWILLDVIQHVGFCPQYLFGMDAESEYKRLRAENDRLTAEINKKSFDLSAQSGRADTAVRDQLLLRDQNSELVQRAMDQGRRAVKLEEDLAKIRAAIGTREYNKILGT